MPVFLLQKEKEGHVIIQNFYYQVPHVEQSLFEKGHIFSLFRAPGFSVYPWAHAKPTLHILFFLHLLIFLFFIFYIYFL